MSYLCDVCRALGQVQTRSSGNAVKQGGTGDGGKGGWDDAGRGSGEWIVLVGSKYKRTATPMRQM